MRAPDYSIAWLDTMAAGRLEPLLRQVDQARAARNYPEAARLCQNFIQRTNNSSQHDQMGLVYCYLGEVYRMMGASHSQMAAEAFGKARLRFALDSSMPAATRNKGVAYWSLAVVQEGRPEEWDDALRNYQSALDSIQGARDQSRLRRLGDHVKELERIASLIEEDYNALLKQIAMGDPKLGGAVRALEDAGEAARQLVQEVEATRASTDQLMERLERASAGAAEPVVEVAQRLEGGLDRLESVARRLRWLDAASRPIITITARFEDLLTAYASAVSDLQLLEARMRVLLTRERVTPEGAALDPVWSVQASDLAERTARSLEGTVSRLEDAIRQQRAAPLDLGPAEAPLNVPKSLLDALAGHADLQPVPIADQPIAAGNPIRVGDLTFDQGMVVHLPPGLLPQRQNLYALCVDGDAAADAMIKAQDMVVVQYRPQVNDGELTLVWLKQQGETTLKYFYRDGSRIHLLPANPVLQPTSYDLADIQVQGQVLLVIRSQ